MQEAPKTAKDTYTPTQEQIDTFARRLAPEIRKFFADEQIQREFAEWKKKQNADG